MFLSGASRSWSAASASRQPGPAAMTTRPDLFLNAGVHRSHSVSVDGVVSAFIALELSVQSRDVGRISFSYKNIALIRKMPESVGFLFAYKLK